MVALTGTLLAKLVFHRIVVSIGLVYLMRESNLHGLDESEARGISRIQCFPQSDNISIVMEAPSFLYMTLIQKECLPHDVMTLTLCLSPANAFEIS